MAQDFYRSPTLAAEISADLGNVMQFVSAAGHAIGALRRKFDSGEVNTEEAERLVAQLSEGLALLSETRRAMDDLRTYIRGHRHSADDCSKR